MIDIDQLERLAKAAGALPWSTEGDIICQELPCESEAIARVVASHQWSAEIAEHIVANSPAAVLALIAELRRLRAALSTPIAMGIKWSPVESSMMSGFSWAVAEDALTREFAKAKSVTVYYGEKRTYTRMAQFSDAHPKEPK